MFNMFKSFQKLTPHAKCQPSNQQHDRELPCLIQNLDADLDDFSSDTACQLNDSFQHVTYPTNSDSGLVDSTDELYTMKSQLRFLPNQPDSDDKINKSWKKSQNYLIPSLSPLLWKILAKILGIPLKRNEKPWLATLLHILTWASTLCFIITRTWYIGYDIENKDSKRRNALKGCIGIVIGIFWGLLAIYANKLAYRMFTHQVFMKNIRMHSKTILKCKASYIIVICGFIFSCLNNLAAKEDFAYSTCEKVNLDPIVCPIMFVSRLILSMFAFLWNTIIALVVLSVCRTHALAIRQFIRELEYDAFAYEDYHRRTFSTSTTVTDVSHFLDEINDDIESQSSLEDINEIRLHSKRIFDVESATRSTHRLPIDSLKYNSNRLELPKCNNCNVDADSSLPLLKPSEILHRYWKLQCSLRLSSSAFKRWLLSFLCLGIIWIGISLVSWLSQEPTVLDIILFVIPLIWMPVLASAVAEVNNEGQRMLRFLCPSEERLRLLMYLLRCPLQMTVYGFGIKYSTVVTTLFGLVAAIMSGVIMQEIKSL